MTGIALIAFPSRRPPLPASWFDLISAICQLTISVSTPLARRSWRSIASFLDLSLQMQSGASKLTNSQSLTANQLINFVGLVRSGNCCYCQVFQFGIDRKSSNMRTGALYSRSMRTGNSSPKIYKAPAEHRAEATSLV